MNKNKIKNSEWGKEEEKLFTLVERNQVEKVRQIINKKKACPSSLHPTLGFSALHLAVRLGSVEMVESLLSGRLGDKINIKDSEGLTPLHLAALYAKYQVMQKLLEKQPNIRSIDLQHRTALHLACLSGHLSCIQLLLVAESPVHFKDKDGKTPLAYAAEKGQASICRLLLENGSEVNEEDLEKKTPLILAAQGRHALVCGYLMDKGALIEVEDSEGHNALWHATTNKDRETIRVLRKSEKEPSKQKLFKKTALKNHQYEPLSNQNKPTVPSISTSDLPDNLYFHSSKLTVHPSSPNGSVFNSLKLSEPQILTDKASSLVHLDSKDYNLGLKSPTHKSYTSVGDTETKLNLNNGLPKMPQSSQNMTLSDDINLNMNFDSFRLQFDDKLKKINLDEKKIPDSSGMENFQVVDLSKEYEERKLKTTSLKKEIDFQYNEENALGFNITLPSIAKSINDDFKTPKSSSPNIHVSSKKENESTPSQTSPTFSEIVNTNQQVIELPRFNVSDQYPNEQESDLFHTPNSSQNGEASKYFVNPQDSRGVYLEREEEKVDLQTYEDLSQKSKPNQSLLQENIHHLNELNLALEKRQELEKEKIDLIKKLEVAMERKEWVSEELREVKRLVDEMVSQLEKSESSGQEDPLLKDKLMRNLINIQKQLEALLSLEVEEVSEGVSGLDQSNYLIHKVHCLEKEKKILEEKLKDLLSENSDSKNQISQVKLLVERANDLKLENQKLIDEYNAYKNFRNEEMAEVDELVRLFKESVTENQKLKFENSKLTQQLEEGINLGEIKSENVKLLFEKMQLEEELKKQKHQFEEISNKLSEVSSLNKVESSEKPKIISENGFPVVKEKNYKVLYDQMKSHFTDLEQEVAAKDNLIQEYDKVLTQYEGLQKETSSLKNFLDQKDQELELLHQKVFELNKSLQESYEDFKKLSEQKNEEMIRLSQTNQTLNEKVKSLEGLLIQKESELKVGSVENGKKKVDLEVQTEIESIELKGENNQIFKDFKNTLMESKTLKEKNNELKEKLKEAYNEKLDEILKLQKSNEELEFEVMGLKRTISEQSAYLAHLSPTKKKGDEFYVSPPLKSHPLSNGEVHHSEETKKEPFENSKTFKKQKMEIEKLKSEIIVLKSQIEAIELNKNQENQKNLKEQKEKNNLIENLSSQLNQIQNKEQNFSELQEKFQRFQDEVKEQEEDFDQLVESFKDLKGNQVKEEGKGKKWLLGEIKSWMENLKSEETIMKNFKQENESLNNKVKILQDSINHLEDEKQNNFKENEKKEKNIGKNLECLKIKLNEEISNVISLKKELDSLKLEKTFLNEKIEKIENDLNNKEELMNSKEKNHSGEVKQFKNELETFKNKIYLEETTSKKLKDQVEELNLKIDKLKNLLEIKDNEIEELNTKKNNEINEIIKEKNQFVSQSNYKINTILLENEELKRKNELKLVVEKKLTSGSHNSTNLDNVDLKKKEEMEKMNMEYNDVRDKVNKLTKEVRDLSKDNFDLKKKIYFFEKNTEDLEKQKKYCEKQIEDMKEKYEKNEKENKEEKLKLQESEKLLESLRLKLKEAGEENNYLVSLNKKLEFQVNNKTTEKASIENNFSYSPPIKHLKSKTKSLISITPPLHQDSLEWGEETEDKGENDLREENKKLKNTINRIEFTFCQPSISKNIAIQTDESFFQSGLLVKYQNSDNFSAVENLSNEYEIEKKSSFDSEGGLGEVLASPIPNLRVSNRRLFLSVVGLQSLIKKKLISEMYRPLSIDRLSPELSHLYTNGGDKNEVRNKRGNLKNEEDEFFLNELSNKCFDNLSILVDLEDKVDALMEMRNLEVVQVSDEGPPGSISSLINELLGHQNTLKLLKQLLQERLSDKISSKEASDKLKKIIFQKFSDNEAVLVYENIKIYKSKPEVCSEMSLSSQPDQDLQKLLTELQQQIMDNEKRYKEIITSYRKHLLSAVQGKMEPKVKEALLDIAQSQDSSSHQKH